MLGAVGLLLAVLVGFKVMQVKSAAAMGAKMAPPPAAVTTSIARAETWQPVLSAVGSMRAVNGVLVSTDLAGIVSGIAFDSGREIKKGELLVKLDTRQEEAQLHSAEAKRELARLGLQRQRDLIAKRAVAQSDLDAAESEFRQSDSAVSEAEALIARKTIVAPFDGQVGIRQVDLGQYLNPGAPIAPLQSIDPIYVEFALPQQKLGEVAIGKKLVVRVDGMPGREFPGEVSALDSKVDESTRNITVQGTVRNPEHNLRPGMYVNVDVLLPPQEGVVSIPASAIKYAPYSDSVFVIKDGKTPGGRPDKEVVQQVVHLGASRGDMVAVLSGLHPGDEVVTSAVFKLHGHDPVTVNNSVQPGEETNPNPPDT